MTQKIVICHSDEEILSVNDMIKEGWKVVIGFSRAVAVTSERSYYKDEGDVIFVLEKEYERFNLGPG
jgi:hypothetical protein